MSFRQVFEQYDFQQVHEEILSMTPADVERALNKRARNLNDFKALISPAALPYLDQMAALSHRLTLQRFGHVIQLFAPLYLSNECQNICTYCGFSMNNKIVRKTLNDEELLREAAALKKMGHDTLLLVSGEANKTVGTDYFEHALRLMRPLFSQLSLEVQPLDTVDYRRLTQAGLHSVLLYQETYHKASYAVVHPKGKKANFNYRLESADRLGQAGVHKIGLGVLLGLDDWRTDSFFTALHLDYLEKNYWTTRYSISFPRLRPCAGNTNGFASAKNAVGEQELVQLICAYRLFNPELECSLSTRERQHFRDHAIKLGITSMSAGSKTNPGGYTQGTASLEQFETDDTRSPAEIAQIIQKNGYQPVWKDWDQALQTKAYL